MNQRVVVTGLGVISPVGNEVDTFWNNLLAGKSGISRIEAFDPSDYTTKIAAEIKDFEPQDYMDKKDIRKTDRFVQFAYAASKNAIESADLDIKQLNPERIGVQIGSGIGGIHTWEKQHETLMNKGPKRVSPFFIPMLIADMASGYVSIAFGAKGPNSSAISACATGTNNIGDAFKIIQRGQADAMITGGAEATIRPMGLAGFTAARAMSTNNDHPEKASRPFDQHRDGFVMGEGSGVVILESLEHAQKRGANILAEVVGYGMSGDAYHLTAPETEGSGASRAMQAALDDASMKPQDIDYINAHGTSTEPNDKVETAAIKRTFEDHAYQLAVSSTKSMHGHLLGATGGVEAIASTLALQNQVIPPTMNYETPDPECDLDYVPNECRQAELNVVMSNTFGFGGHNATIVLKKYNGA